MTETHRYVALLRALNVGGHSVVKMSDLRRHFEAFGLAGVSTYIQSGNVLFTSTETDADALAARLAAHLEASLGYRVRIFVLARPELEQAASHNPFAPICVEGEYQCHLMFLSGEPDAPHRDALMAVQGEEYRFAVFRRVLYYAYPKANAGRRRTIDFEKLLGVEATARTWKVVDALIELLSI